ncbi:MAG TPA: hypothetical protein DCZ34_00920, partial [Clostridiales bacterium]|nr:hypothetical protein [Clostridiales bacterium]
ALKMQNFFAVNQSKVFCFLLYLLLNNNILLEKIYINKLQNFFKSFENIVVIVSSNDKIYFFKQ